MSSHSARMASPISRMLSVENPVLLRVAFAAGGAAVTARLVGIVALAVW
jgi:hypothetical protein